MPELPMDAHFRAAVVPSRTQDPEPVLLWDGLPAVSPLRAEPGPAGAVVLDAEGRELRRFEVADGSDALALAQALVSRLEEMRSGQPADVAIPAADPAGMRRAVTPSVDPQRVRRAAVAVLALVLMAGGVISGILAASAGSGVDVTAETASGADLVESELARLDEAEQLRHAKGGSYTTDLADLGFTPVDGVTVEVEALEPPAGYTATGKMGDASCTLTVHSPGNRSIQCGSPPAP